MNTLQLNLTLNIDYYLEEFVTSFVITHGYGRPLFDSEFKHNYKIEYVADLEWNDFSKNEVLEWLEGYFPDKEIYPEIQQILTSILNIIYNNKEKVNILAKDIISKIEEHNNNISSKTKEAKERVKKKYSLETYVAPKGSKPITYNGITYKSKIQCKILNDLTDSELASIVNGKDIK